MAQMNGGNDFDADTDWGDDMDDLLLSTALDQAEICGTNVYEGLPSTSSSTTKVSFQRYHSDEIKAINPSQNFALRRQQLVEKELSNNFSTDREWTNGAKWKDSELHARINQLEAESNERKEQMLRYQGEAKNLRMKYEMLLKDNKNVENKSHQKEMEHRQMVNKKDEEIRQLKLQVKEMEMEKIKRNFVSPKSSFSRSNVKSTPSPKMSSIQLEVYKQRADFLPAGEREAFLNSLVQKPLETSETGVQTEEQATSKVKPMEIEDRSNVGRSQKIETSAMNCSKSIFKSLSKLVELRYQLILPNLRRIVKRAPMEVMKRLQRADNKSAFPDVMDSMFQWSLEQERHKNQSLLVQEEPLSMPSQSQSSPGTNYHESVKPSIKRGFEFWGFMGAMREVKKFLLKFLEKFENSADTGVYEFHNLSNLLRLLMWANELWKCVLVEEELCKDKIMENTQAWCDELRSWTSVIIKLDWRDYFVPELIGELHCLTLSILESIVTTGYYDHTAKRTHALYGIFHEVLSTDAFRNEANVRCILRIILWSLADVHIMKYMCFKSFNSSNAKCLARVLGENVAKMCRRNGDLNSVEIACIYVEYMYLLEALRQEQHRPLFLSQFARMNKVDVEEERENNNEQKTDRMEYYESMMSQYACPVKYEQVDKNENETLQNTNWDELKQSLKCWANPTNYEDLKGNLKRCQCRKYMHSTCITVLLTVVESWRKNYFGYEKNVEEVQSSDLDELLKLGSEGRRRLADSEENRLSELKLKQEKIASLSNMASQADPFLQREWNIEDLLRFRLKVSSNDVAVVSLAAQYEKREDILDYAIFLGLTALDFLYCKCDNLAAAVGTEAYKARFTIFAYVRLYLDQLNLDPFSKKIVLGITAQFDESHLGAGATSSKFISDPKAYQPSCVSCANIEYPIPLTPLAVDLDSLISEFEVGGLTAINVSSKLIHPDESEIDRVHSKLLTLDKAMETETVKIFR